MRFRKVRSLLSAFSNDELDGARQEMVREQLATNESLQREAMIFEKIKAGCESLPKPEVSKDFNTRLLNRIAEARFEQTRSKAYYPAKVPGLLRRIAVPVMSTMAIALVVLVGYSSLDRLPNLSPPLASSPTGMDNSYLTVLPENDPGLRSDQPAGGSLQKLVRRVDKANEISALLTGSTPFASNNRLAGQNWSGPPTIMRWQTPFGVRYYIVKPIPKHIQMPRISQGEARTY